ncbi:MAG TPA: ABC transporter ATP-binding protein [Cyanobacteria bacterium UBA11369]|nr:ABC transporter ATP-binding protein [Cyanobacteria bacterium UBA11371]HBE33367.1 ABC transporter ATP-binding protein [Cyanobacteria bacterium UBA11368]HBE47707.1 ABC transporter ATP-binding protein [Cyanobacteria bacterium UBA11369]
MALTPETNDLSAYLTASELIDYEDKGIQAVAAELSERSKDRVELAKAAYEYVRDSISHSCDIQGRVVTCEASSVLRHKEGICYAKSHLLAAILRSLKIPTGFCYQKLVFDDSDLSYLTLHGLNAIYLENLDKWIRVDARGNKQGVQAEFNIEKECLAFPVREELGESDYPIIYAKPNESVVAALRNIKTLEALMVNLPQEV